MAGKSDYLRNAILNAIFNHTALDVTAVYVSLHTADCGVNGANELAGGTYARQALSSGAPSSGALANDVEVSYTGLPVSTVSYAGFWDADVAGNFLWGYELTTPRTFALDDDARFKVGDIDVVEGA